MRRSRASTLSDISRYIYDDDIREELAEAVASAYQFLSDEQLEEILWILDNQATSDRIKRAGILAICNE